MASLSQFRCYVSTQPESYSVTALSALTESMSARHVSAWRLWRAHHLLIASQTRATGNPVYYGPPRCHLNLWPAVEGKPA